MKKVLLSLFLAVVTVASIGVSVKADEVTINNKTNKNELMGEQVISNGEKAVHNGWYQSYGSYYYYEDGVKAKGWRWIEGNYFYFSSKSGKMLTGDYLIDKNWYKFSSGGAMLTGWQTDTYGNFQFFGSDGARYENEWHYDGYDWYYINGIGEPSTGITNIGGVYYLFNSIGVMQTGWSGYYDLIGEYQYKYKYYGQGGGMYTNQWLNDDGYWYYFGNDGLI